MTALLENVALAISTGGLANAARYVPQLVERVQELEAEVERLRGTIEAQAAAVVHLTDANLALRGQLVTLKAAWRGELSERTGDALADAIGAGSEGTQEGV